MHQTVERDLQLILVEQNNDWLTAEEHSEMFVRNIFQFSKVTPPKIPSQVVRTAIRVIDPVRLAPSTYNLHNETLIELRYENSHPTHCIKLVDAHFHLENTEKVQAHRRTVSPSRIPLQPPPSGDGAFLFDLLHSC